MLQNWFCSSIAFEANHNETSYLLDCFFEVHPKCFNNDKTEFVVARSILFVIILGSLNCDEFSVNNMYTFEEEMTAGCIVPS